MSNSKNKCEKKTEGKPFRLSIRYAKSEDMGEVWALDRYNLIENWDLHPATGRSLTARQFEKQHKQGIIRWYKPEEQRIIVAVTEGRIVGLAWYGLQEDTVFGFNVGFLFSLVVHPDFRRMGIAKRLLKEFMRRCRKHGMKYVRLAVLHNNNHAINLYRQNGFFDETHYMMARLEPTAPEKAKQEAAKRKSSKPGK